MQKPLAATVLIAVAGTLKIEGVDFTLDAETGVVSFAPGSIPAAGVAVTAGFEFDVPVRFDADRLEINLDGFRHGSIPNIPLVEIKL